MKLRRVVLVNQSKMLIPGAHLARVAVALQIQVERDLGPAWGVRAHVTALGAEEPVPEGAWPIRIIDKAPDALLGVHLDAEGRPFAQVTATRDWTVSASHELLEMLVDPLGHRFVNALSISPRSRGERVMYLVEVADPCETFSYSIGGVEVSDFVLPGYFHARSGESDVDFLGRLTEPLDVPHGGYLSWLDTVDGHWYQKTADGHFVRAHQKADFAANPREDRDRKLANDVRERHDKSRIRSQPFSAHPWRDASSSSPGDTANVPDLL